MADDDAYVHDPATFREEVDDTRTDGTSTDDSYRSYESANGPPVNDASFGWRGWVLVVALAVAFVVVPLTLLYLPQARPVVRSFGLSFRDAYLVLPLVPALVLGVLAVWAAVNARRRD